MAGESISALVGDVSSPPDMGRMGLCQPNTKPGDEVWIMRGVPVPFTVRPRQSAEPGAAEQYAMLGDCFLLGIMDGELGDKEKMDQRYIIMT